MSLRPVLGHCFTVCCEVHTVLYRAAEEQVPIQHYEIPLGKVCPLVDAYHSLVGGCFAAALVVWGEWMYLPDFAHSIGEVDTVFCDYDILSSTPPCVSRNTHAKARMVRTGSDVTVVTYGAQVHVCNAACEKAEQELGISIDLIDLRSVSPWDVEVLMVFPLFFPCNLCAVAAWPCCWLGCTCPLD